MLGGGLPLATQVSDTSGLSRKVCSLNCEWKTGGTSRKEGFFLVFLMPITIIILVIMNICFKQAVYIPLLINFSVSITKVY